MLKHLLRAAPSARSRVYNDAEGICRSKHRRVPSLTRVVLLPDEDSEGRKSKGGKSICTKVIITIECGIQV